MMLKTHWRKGIISILFVGLGLMAGSQMGSGTPPTPTPTPPPPGAVAIAITAGNDHSCAVVQGGTLKCWGDNDSGQLGTGSTSDLSATPVDVSGVSGAALAAAGDDFTCVLVSTTVKCWGRNDGDQNQVGSLCGLNFTNPCLTPTEVANLGSAASATAGQFHGCARTGSGAKCWGGNHFHQLANGMSQTSNIAFPVCKSDPEGPATCDQLVGIASGTGTLDAGRLHTCAVMNAGTAECWGNRTEPIVLGDPVLQPSNVYTVTVCETGSSFVSPSTCVPLSGIAKMEAGGQHTCALTTAGAVKCWGKNTGGQVSHGSGCVGGLCPVGAVDLSGAVATALAGGTTHTCALISDGTVRCWGSNAAGQLGDGQGCGTVSCGPVIVSGLNSATAIAALGDHTCALLQTGAVKCWGANGSGQLGNGTLANSNVPVSVTGFGP